jgi:DNA-binding NarL/FixJ family response regulator
VKSHVTNLLNRLNLRNRAQLAIYAHSFFSDLDRADCIGK